MLELKTYKNYKELCTAIGWKVASGNTKKAQLNFLESICEYHKDKNKFIIDKILKENIDFNNYQAYQTKFSVESASAILRIVLNKVDTTKKNIVDISRQSLILSTGIAKNNLFDKKDILKGCSKLEVNDYKNRAISFSYEVIKSGLSYLKSRRILLHREVYYGTFKNYSTGKSHQRELYDFEVADILKIEQQILQEMNTSHFILIKTNKYKDFVSKVLEKYNYDDDNYLESYQEKIRFITTDLSEEFLLNEAKKDNIQIRTDLWKATNKSFIDRAIKRQLENKDKAQLNFDFHNKQQSGFIEKPDYTPVYYCYENYLDNIKTLENYYRKPN